MVNAKQISTGSGFNPITDNFVVRVGDEIRFGGTETQTFYINRRVYRKWGCYINLR
jgi:hypothetical protein